MIAIWGTVYNVVCIPLISRGSRKPRTLRCTRCRLQIHCFFRGDWKCETWICGTSLHGWKLRDMKTRDQFAGVENAGKVSMESQSVKKCLKAVSYSFSISLFAKWMWNGTILDNRTRLLMKLLTTSSADIIQECRVMFGVKSVSKSILSAGVTFCLLLFLRCQIYDE